MKQHSAFAHAPKPAQWSWPLDLGRYDKDPQIHPLEYAELEKRFQNGKNGHIYPHTIEILRRFVDPILDVLSQRREIPRAWSPLPMECIPMSSRVGATRRWWGCPAYSMIVRGKPRPAKRQSGKRNERSYTPRSAG